MLTAQRWLELWLRLGATRQADGALAEAYAGLMERFAETHRHYHTARHISECLTHFDNARAQLGSLIEHAGEIELALWFHDAIYNPRAKDNEAQSASWAVRVMQDASVPADSPAEARARVHGLIMATCHDALPDTPDAQVLVDIDLAILGADAERFDEYEREVRAEYAFVPEFLFRRTRKKILQGFLARAPIYSPDFFRENLEKKTRENLARSLAGLND